MGCALRNQGRRFAKWHDGEELYSLSKDSGGKTNLAGRDQLKVRLDEFRRVLKIRQKQAADRRQN